MLIRALKFRIKMKKHRATHSCTSFTVFSGTFFRKRLGQLFLLAALLMVPFLTSAQSWDTVRIVDFSNPSFTDSLTGVQGFAQQGFERGNNGASGSFNDLCAFTNSFSAQDRIAMRVSLVAGVDYRVSLNGKVNRTGQAVNFAYAPASNLQQVTVISQSIQLADIHYEDPGATVQSDTFSVAADGNYWVVAEHGGVNLSWVFARLDNFMVEALEEASMPSLSFTDNDGNPITGTVDAEPGTPLTLCLSPNIAPPEDTTAILSITGSPDPHFSDFDSINLTFPAGSIGSQCFELSPASDTTAGTYTFQLTDGNGEEVMSFGVGVEPPCTSVAGPDHTICAGETVQLGTGCLPAPHPVDSVEYCYAWEPADGLDHPASAMPNATPSETTTYTVYVTTSKGELIVEEEVTVTIKPAPDINVTPAKSVLCSGQITTLEVAPTAGYSYEWSTGEETVSIEVNSPGDYTVTATNSNQCQTISTAEVLDAGSDGEGIATYLESIGFYQYPASVQVTVMGEEQLSGEDDQSRNPVNVCDDIECGSSTGVCVKDHANYAIRIAGELMPDLESEVTDHLNYFASEFGYSNIKAFITRNDDICLCPGGYLDQVFSAFSSSEAAFWIHIVDIESSEQDKFYLMSNMPGASSNLPSSTAHRQRLDQSIIRNISDPSTSDFNSNATQSLYGAMFHLLNSHTSIEGEEQEELTPCENPPLIANYVTPAGVILQLGQGTIPRFNPSKNFKDKLPIGSLTGFLDNDFYYYTGMVRDYFDPTAEDYFLGYYSDSRRPAYTAEVTLPQTNHEVLLGIISSLYPSTSDEELANCQKIMVRQVRLSPMVTPNNDTGEGILLNVPFFDAWVATDVLEDEQTFVSEYYINCPPQIPDDVFFNTWVFPHVNGVTNEITYYFYFCEKDPETDEKSCKYVYSYLDPTGQPAYKYWDCNQGGWIPFDIAYREAYDVLGGLIFAAYETVLVPMGYAYLAAKIAIDIVALTGHPVFVAASAVTDIPLGLFFLGTGQHEEGVITMVGGAIGVTAVYLNGTLKLVRQSGSLAKQVKSLFIRKGLNSGGATITVSNVEMDKILQAVQANNFSEEIATQFMNDLLNNSKGLPLLEKMLNNIRTGNSLDNWPLVKAWDDLRVRNVPDILRTNTKFLSRLSDNPNLVNYIDNLTIAGKTDLADNADLWIKRYDARAPLKNGNYSQAINILGGTSGASEVYNGANYVGKLNTPQSPDPTIATPASLQAIVNSTTDVSSIANNLGVSQSVVQVAKQHLFVTEHLIETAPGVFTQGRFNTFHHITQWWNSGVNGTISSADAVSLRKLLGHEYIESALMQQGLVYRQLDVPSAGKYGAHELSVGEGSGNFSHWANGLERNAPSFSLNPDLSNIDNVVDQIKVIEGL
jgi:hypothetical protein